MSQTNFKRWRVLLPLLVLAGWLALFGDKTPSDSNLVGVTARVDVPVKSPQIGEASQDSPRQMEASSSSNVRRPRARIVVALDKLVPRDMLIPTRGSSLKGTQDLFVAGSWLPPPPRNSSTNDLAPVAPPIPFLYLGKKFDGTSWEVFLGRGEHSFVVGEGAVIEGIYRIDSISPPTLTLTYMPLKQTQSMAIGDSL